MQLKVLGSSSSGNCYLLIANNGDTLILEAGVHFSEVKEALNFDLSKVCALVVSHRHGDHFKHVKEFAKAGITVCASLETLNALEFDNHRLRVLQGKSKYEIGPFKVMPFDVKHDVECFGFMISHPESGNILFVTDTVYLPYKFKNLNQLIIEANYSKDILDRNLSAGGTVDFVRNRVVQSHMSLDTCKDVLRANDLTAVNNIVLIHLSDSNSDSALFQSEVASLTGKTVHIGDKNLSIDFNLEPF